MTPSAITQSSSPASAASAGATLSDLIVQSLTRHSSSEAFVAGDRRLTYAQVRDLVSQYMGALSRRGVGLGVGVTSPGSAGATEVRLLFVFDPDRQAVILVGGDKAGNWSGWYRVAVPQAEQAYAEHLKRIDGEDGAR
ncbi:type II toxin-antitoxin system RelE/ParE family toxin [Streptomyces sp. NBC_00289]|uniref:type II toxin-antitoxin system RelE/ParE family toxin n=1 Tax=Streptomyces sp. NBC_00289 TaxID=2975703 RepID=UPI00324937DB